MQRTDPLHVGYVVKRFPRYSETFVLNEMLAHEAAGVSIDVFSLYPPNDTHFQDGLSRLRAPVRYLLADGLRAPEFWTALQHAATRLPRLWASLDQARGAEAREVYQAVQLAVEVQTRGIEVLHAHFGTTAAEVARLAGLFAGVPYTVTLHAKDIFHESVRPEDLSRKLAGAAAAVTVSDFNVQYLTEQCGPVARKVRRIYNGVALEALPYERPQGREPLVAAVGRLVEKKGFADLIDACAMLAPRRRFTCEILGTGPLEPDLRQQMTRLGLDDRVRLVGPRPTQEVLAFIRRAAVFVVPSVIASDGDRDGLPTTLLEAMAVGTPAVGTPVTGMPEALRHEETGLLVPPHEPALLAAAIERLLSDESLGLDLSRRARCLIETSFDLRKSAAALREILQSSPSARRPWQVSDDARGVCLRRSRRAGVWMEGRLGARAGGHPGARGSRHPDRPDCRACEGRSSGRPGARPLDMPSDSRRGRTRSRAVGALGE